MQYVTSLFIQLCRPVTAKDASAFCGKVVQLSLHQGNSSEESDLLVKTLITCAILCRLNGDRLRLIRELCPTLYYLVKEAVEEDKGIEHGVSFEYFFDRVISS